MNGLRTWQSVLRRGTVGAYQTSLICYIPVITGPPVLPERR
jgi:hypothetical protein